MSEKIKRSDISEDDVFGGVTASITKALKELDNFDSSLKVVAETLKRVSEAKITPDSKSLKELDAAIEAAAKATEDKIRSDKKRAEMEAKLAEIQELLKKRQEAATQATVNAVKQGKQVVNMNEQIDDSYVKVLGTLDDNVKALARLKKEKAALDAQSKKNKKTDLELEKRQAFLKEAIAQTNIVIKQQVKEQSLAEDSSQQLEVRLGLMRRAYRELTVEEQNSDFGQKLFNQIQVARAGVESTNESIGNFHDSVGNYAKGAISAAQSTGIFTTGISGLDAGISNAITGLINFTFNTRKSKDGTEAATAAVGGLTRALRVAGTVAKTGGLLAIVGVAASVTSMFSAGDKGARALNEALAYLNIAASLAVQTFSYLNDELTLLSLKAEKALLGLEKMLSFGSGESRVEQQIKNIDSRIDALSKKTANFSFKEMWDRIIRENEAARDSFNATFDIRRQVIKYEGAITGLTVKLSLLNDEISDNTISIKDQMAAMEKADIIERRLYENKVALAKAEKSLADAEAAKLEARAFGGGSVEAEEIRAAAIRKVAEAEAELTAVIIEQARTTRESEIKLFEERFRLAITTSDFIREYLAKQVKDERLSVESRIAMQEKASKSITEALQASFSEFSNIALKLGSQMDLLYEDGKVFLNGQLLEIDNAIKMQEQLSALNLPKTIVDQFAVFIGEKFKMALIGMDEMAKSTEGLRNALQGLKDQTAISAKELGFISAINDKYRELLNAPKEQREFILEEISRLNEELKVAQENANIERLTAQIKMWEEENKALEENSISKQENLKKMADAEVEIEKIKNDQLKRLLDEQKKAEEKAEKEKEERAKKSLENQRTLARASMEAMAMVTTFYEHENNRQLASLDLIVRQQQDLRNQLTAMAAEGNIEAQQSIAATIEAEREAEREKMEIERRKQRMQLITQGIQSYLSALESGKSPLEALTETTIVTGALMAFLGGLKGFKKGTDNAPEGWAWTQEEGAEIITDKAGKIKTFGSDSGAVLTKLEAGDKVFNAKKTSEMLKHIDGIYNTPKMELAIQNGGNDGRMILKELQSIKNAIENGKSESLDFEAITQSYGVLTHSLTRGQNKTISKHYIKP